MAAARVKGTRCTSDLGLGPRPTPCDRALRLAGKIALCPRCDKETLKFMERK